MILQVAYIRSNDSTLVIRSMALVDRFPWWKAQGFLVPDVAHGRYLWSGFRNIFFAQFWDGFVS